MLSFKYATVFYSQAQPVVLNCLVWFYIGVTLLRQLNPCTSKLMRKPPWSKANGINQKLFQDEE